MAAAKERGRGVAAREEVMNGGSGRGTMCPLPFSCNTFMIDTEEASHHDQSHLSSVSSLQAGIALRERHRADTIYHNGKYKKDQAD
eukprot:9470071-Pyramimonas_sp.AAC.1